MDGRSGCGQPVDDLPLRSFGHNGGSTEYRTPETTAHEAVVHFPHDAGLGGAQLPYQSLARGDSPLGTV